MEKLSVDKMEAQVAISHNNLESIKLLGEEVSLISEGVKGLVESTGVITSAWAKIAEAAIRIAKSWEKTSNKLKETTGTMKIKI